MNGYTEVEKQPLPGGNVNQPASGTYGEGVALDRLKKQFPSAAGGEGEGGLQPSAPPQIDPTKVGGTPPDLGGRPDTGGAAPPPGIPAAILHPTQEPNVPVGTPLAVDTPRPLLDVRDMRQRLALLDRLAESPEVSAETREFATLARRVLTEG